MRSLHLLPLVLIVGFSMVPSSSNSFQISRSVVMASQGMVATSHPLAAQIGLDVLKKGGNAIDAAIATNAAMGLLEPMMCGVGGDLHALVWDNKSGKLYALNASGRSPYKATRKLFAERGMKEIPLQGPLSWSVPGCVDGWDVLLKRFGTKKLSELLEPSIHYADLGTALPEVIAEFWKQAEEFKDHRDFARTFLVDGKAPGVGDVHKNPALARTYRDIAAGGRDAFYRGRIAKEIIAFSDRVGGLFTMKDFEDHTSTWVDSVSTTYRGHEVFELPPPTQGISVLQMLNVLEGYDLKTMGFASADYWHLFLEAKKLAYADRARHYADPTMAKVPTQELISKNYAAQRRKLIDMHKARDFEPGDPKLSRSDTVYLCVVDKDRNCVSLIQSIYYVFGSGLVPGELGFVLQNRGNLFALDENHPNRLEPHKRPFHTIIPAMVMKEKKPWLVFGVMGGDMQPQGQVQVLCNLIDFGMNIQEAGEAPRLEHTGSPSPTGAKGKPGGGEVIPEKGIDAKILDELRRRGHQIVSPKINTGGFQGILIEQKTNILHGGSDPRKDGCAAGY